MDDAHDSGYERAEAMEMAADRADEVRAALLAILDGVDYTTGACRPNEQVGVVLPAVLIENARKALER